MRQEASGSVPSLPLAQVVRLSYVDRQGVVTERVVEPVGYVLRGGHWYAVAWCRLRGGPRAFRVDRIRAARGTGEPAPRRLLQELDLGVDAHGLRPLMLAETGAETPT